MEAHQRLPIPPHHVYNTVAFTHPAARIGLEQIETGPDNRRLQEYEIRGLAAIYWPPEEVTNVYNVVMCESGGWTGAWARVGEDSRGLLQMNVAAHPALARWNLFDPQINFYFAFQLWLARGWQPWTCAQKLGIA